jgi:hypothetical protein
MQAIRHGVLTGLLRMPDPSELPDSAAPIGSSGQPQWEGKPALRREVAA